MATEKDPIDALSLYPPYLPLSTKGVIFPGSPEKRGEGLPIASFKIILPLSDTRKNATPVRVDPVNLGPDADAITINLFCNDVMVDSIFYMARN